MLINKLITDNNIAPNSAAPKPIIVNPATIFAASKRTNALITKVNNPKVSKLSGSVKSSKNGRIKIFASPITNAAIIAVG